MALATTGGDAPFGWHGNSTHALFSPRPTD
jgi:hypothetical protein